MGASKAKGGALVENLRFPARSAERLTVCVFNIHASTATIPLLITLTRYSFLSVLAVSIVIFPP